MARDRRRRAGGAGARFLLLPLSVAMLVGLVVAPARAQEAPVPDVTIAGTSSAEGAVNVGDRFSYDLLVTNLGEGRANGITVLARIPRGLRVVNLLPTIEGGRCSVAGVGGPLRFVVVCERTVLGPGVRAAISIDVEVVAAAPCRALVMRADVSAEDEPADLVDAANAMLLTDRTVCPAISIRARAPRFAHMDDRVALSFDVSNLGGTDLVRVSVSDRSCDSAPRRSLPGSGNGILSPGDSWNYSCAATVGPHQRTRHVARVAARDRDGVAVSATDAYAVAVLSPALRVEVAPSPTTGTPGTLVVRRYRITNTGDAELHHVIVREDGLGRVGSIGKLAPGASVLLRRRVPLPDTVGRVVRTVTVVGRDRLGLAVSDTARSAVEVVKDPRGGPGTAFSGPSGVVPFGAAAVLLGAVGAASLVATRRRRAAHRARAREARAGRR